MKLKICGAHEIAQFRGMGFTHMISIGDWDDSFDGLRLPEISADRHLCLRFTDTEVAIYPDAPTDEKVAPLFEWLSQHDVSGLLVHCSAGISRSPAVAVLSLSATMPDRSPYEHMNSVIEAAESSYIWPNPLVIEIGDRLLKRGGEIVAGVDRWRSRKPDLL